MRTIALILALGSMLLVPRWTASPAPEKVDLTPDQLLRTATHVVVGEVKQIWTRDDSHSTWRKTAYCAEIAVTATEKGDGVKAGDVVYARYWSQAWRGIGTPPPGTSGHRGRPNAGDRVRVYLARNAYDGFGTTSDGGFNVIGANGFAAP